MSRVALLQLRLSLAAHTRLRALAAERGVSLNRLVVWSLRHFGRCKAAADEFGEKTKHETPGRR